ncbi:MAG: undecaprenyl-diphosphatase UppP [SAR202 cluster bacterium]|nr:undecaprenyl-diphosphatase UppP [SAR202 cluster bacterium]
MSLWEAILLGLIHGLTEFIPISSTGQVTIAGQLLDLIDPDRPEQWTAFLAMLQLGTLAALLAYFAGDIVRIVRGFALVNLAALTRRAPSDDNRRNARLGWLVLAGTVPIGVVGLLFRDVIEGDLTKNLWTIAAALVGLALLLFLAERVGTRKRGMAQLRWLDAVVVGIAQVASLIPGSSRSGTTITGGLFSGLQRETAARFSFLLAIPAIGASGILQLPEALRANMPPVTLGIATLVAAASGYLSIAFLLRYLQRHSTYLFIVYRIALGVLIVALIVTGAVDAS